MHSGIINRRSACKPNQIHNMKCVQLNLAKQWKVGCVTLVILQ